jgi:ankyrin repeat domain-containing protein 17
MVGDYCLICILYIILSKLVLSFVVLSGANINAQTEETQETALTLACCGGFSEVADFLIKAGADIELGCSTPLMEASQEGHLELVKYLLAAGTWL